MPIRRWPRTPARTAYGRHAGQQIDALRRRHRQRAELPGLDLAEARDDRIEHDVGAAGEQIGLRFQSP